MYGIILDEKSLQHIKDYIIENDFIGREFDGVPGRYDEDDPDGEGLREDMLLKIMICWVS